jgi:hypothetical protein
MHELLRERGYMPQEAMQGNGEWFDLLTDSGMVRVILESGADVAEVVTFDRNGVQGRFYMRFSTASPVAAMAGALDLAESAEGK